jgi:hypothetical protein
MHSHNSQSSYGPRTELLAARNGQEMDTSFINLTEIVILPLEKYKKKYSIFPDS